MSTPWWGIGPRDGAPDDEPTTCWFCGERFDPEEAFEFNNTVFCTEECLLAYKKDLLED